MNGRLSHRGRRDLLLAVICTFVAGRRLGRHLRRYARSRSDTRICNLGMSSRLVLRCDALRCHEGNTFLNCSAWFFLQVISARLKLAGRSRLAVACDVLRCQQFCSPLWQLQVQLRSRVLTPLVPACISTHSSLRVATARLSFHRVEKVNISLLLFPSRESIQFRAVQRQKY